MFMVLEMEDGGIDVESFVFNTAYQALFAFLQVRNVCHWYCTVFNDLKSIHQYYVYEHLVLIVSDCLRVGRC